jgi:hypothetical protein
VRKEHRHSGCRLFVGWRQQLAAAQAGAEQFEQAV